MKKSMPLFVLVLGCAVGAQAAPPATLTTLHAIHSLTNAEASKGLPVDFQATVTFYGGRDGNLFVQDGDEAIFVKVPAHAGFLPGDRVLVRGITAGEFRPDAHSNNITVLGHGDVPKPVPATFDGLIRAKYDCMLVVVHGVARSVDREVVDSDTFTRIQLLTDGGYIGLLAHGGNDASIRSLLDADVEVAGVAVATTDGKNQATGSQLYVPSMDNVKILEHADANPWAFPITPMGDIIGSHLVHDLTTRIRVHGTITYYDPGTAIALQDGPKSVWIETRTRVPMQVGDVADAIGFADLHDGFLTLTHAEIQDSGVNSPVPPQPSNWTALTSSTQLFDLVSIEGQVVTEVQEDSQDEYVLRTDDRLFTAIFRNLAGTTGPPMKQVPLGSRVRVTGICILSDSNPFNGKVPFNILLRSFDDIAVVASPSLLNIKNLIIVIGLLVAVVFAVGARGWAVEYRVRRQTAELGSIELRRSRILEDINGSRPLAEIIEQITELVSFKLRGAPCWCQIADGAQLGNCPPKLTGLRIVQNEIPSHTGPALGTLFAAFDPRAKLGAKEPEAVAMAIALIALAIETRRLYSDLRHRSEFDLLTDIHNRFSLDKNLDRLIDEAREKAGIFGLIYIDLDKFKQVNDLYGHQIGDLYLQEVALRMKHQLRSVDMLARLGGDEFAVLLPQLRNRAKVEEIAHRLERCFDEPFACGEHKLQGSASVGFAIYPEDGATKDALLGTADAAMYLAKHGKNEVAL